MNEIEERMVVVVVMVEEETADLICGQISDPFMFKFTL
jgi:hypothetical protein